jgi:hypothetical protein
MHQIKSVGYIFLGLVCHNLCEFPTYIFFAKLLTSFMWGQTLSLFSPSTWREVEDSPAVDKVAWLLIKLHTLWEIDDEASLRGGVW